jgi:hypothetical protein
MCEQSDCSNRCLELLTLVNLGLKFCVSFLQVTHAKDMQMAEIF